MSHSLNGIPPLQQLKTRLKLRIFLSHSLNGIPPLQLLWLDNFFNKVEVSQPKRHPAPATEIVLGGRTLTRLTA